MEYSIRELKEGIAVVDYPNGQWAQIPMTEEMTKEIFEDLVIQFGPKAHVAPSWVAVGPGVAAPLPPVVEEITYIDLRIAGYGSPEQQLEMIEEQGIDAWRDHIRAVKEAHPAPTGE